MSTARRGIDRSRPAVNQAAENYRLVQARARVGDATSAEITDALSTLTRSQQDYLNSIHDYLIALVRLEFAMGLTPTPASLYRRTDQPEGRVQGPAPKTTAGPI